MINPMDLSNKQILVTGASSGIGRATAIHISKLGAKVVMVARRLDELENTLKMLDGKGHKYYHFDLTTISDIEGFIKNIVKEVGPFDGFVHCAGIGTPRPLAMTKYENVHQIMLINFYAFFELVRVLSKRGSFNPGMSMVGISSIASVLCLPS